MMKQLTTAKQAVIGTTKFPSQLECIKRWKKWAMKDTHHWRCDTFRYLAIESFGNQFRLPLPLLLVDDVTIRSMTSIDEIRDGISHDLAVISRENQRAKEVVELVYLSAGTRFSLPPPFPHFYRLILFVHTFRALQPFETDHKTPENNQLSCIFFSPFKPLSRQLNPRANEIESKIEFRSFLVFVLLPVKSSFSIRPEASLTSSGSSIKNFEYRTTTTDSHISSIKLFFPTRILYDPDCTINWNDRRTHLNTGNRRRRPLTKPTTMMKPAAWRWISSAQLPWLSLVCNKFQTETLLFGWRNNTTHYYRHTRVSVCVSSVVWIGPDKNSNTLVTVRQAHLFFFSLFSFSPWVKTHLDSPWAQPSDNTISSFLYWLLNESERRLDDWVWNQTTFSPFSFSLRTLGSLKHTTNEGNRIKRTRRVDTTNRSLRSRATITLKLDQTTTKSGDERLTNSVGGKYLLQWRLWRPPWCTQFQFQNQAPGGGSQHIRELASVDSFSIHKVH